MAILLLGTTIGGYAAIHAGNIASQSVNYANTSGSTTGSATSLVSPNGATVIAGDSAMPAGAQSFIHTLAQGPGGNDGHILGMTWANASIYGAQIFLDTDPNDIMAIRSRSNAGVWTSWKTVIHSGTIGSQSVSYATTAGALTSMNISQFTNNSGYLTAETDTLASVTGRGATTTASITAERYRGNNSLILNAFTTVNPSSNVFLYSQANDRDSWIYLDSADTGSNWGIYHRQIDSAVGGMEGNSIGFIGGGASALRAYIGLSTGNAYFAGTMSAAGHLFASHNGSNILLKSADNASEAGILLQNSGGSFKFQIYGNGTDYGFLNGNWAAWDIRKTIGGAMYMNNDSTYYLSTSSTSNFYALNILGNAVIHAGNIGSQSVNYATTAGSAPNGSNVNNFYDATAGNGYGFRFWSGSDAYKISMGASSLYYYGPVTDYSIKMQMNDGDTGRGFTWGRQSFAPIAALNSTSGDMRIAGSFTANLIIKSGGTSSQFLKADGTVDSTSYVPPSRTLTINGVTQDLSASRSFTVTVSDPTKLPLSGGTLTGTLIGTTIRARGAQTVGNYTTAALWTESYDDTTTGIAFHISGNQGKFLEMRMDGILYWHGSQVVTNTGTWAINVTGNAGTATTAVNATTAGYATTAGSANQIDGWDFTNTGSNASTAPDTIDSNGISYTGVALLGQTDGALYSQRHSTPWQHQIFGDYRTGQIAVRGKNNGTWQSWRTILDSTNYVNYAWPLEGSWKPASLSSSTRLRGATSPDGGEFGLAYSGGQIHPYADGFFYQNEGAYRVIDTNSVGSYAPTLTGGGASGTWAISISGNAATASSVAWGNVTSKPLEIFNYDGWVNSPGYDASTIAGNKSGFTYSNNAPYTGPLTHFAASGYGLQFNASYSSGGTGIAFRTRNGDEALFNPWRVLLNSANYTAYAPSLTGSGASGTWGISITGNAVTANSAAYASNAGNAASVSSITSNTGLIRDRLAASGLIDTLTTANFRTTLFGASTQGYQISTARWNTTPTALPGQNSYGTMIAWAGADTHGFLALDYSGANATVGGGSGDAITWSKKLAFADGTGVSGTWAINITGNATYALNSTRLYASDGSYVYGGAAPYYMYMNYDGGSYWELKVSPATPAGVRVAYANVAGSASVAGTANAVAWANVSGTPTTLAGYGITNALPLAGGTMTGIIVVPSGTAINFSGQSDSFGYNSTSGLGTYIKGTGSTYIYGGGSFYDGTVQRALLHAGNYNSYAPTLTGTGASGSWAISITGSSGSVAWGNITSRPDWMTSASLIATHSNANSQVNSGFYENAGGGTNWPSATWYNSINVRHSNQGNYHGFQIAMSYYDNILWFRSYQGTVGTFQTWAYAISSANIASQSVAYATDAGTLGTYANTTFVGKNGNTYYQADTWIQFNASTGLYWPSYYGAHLHANDLSNYTQLAIRGTKGGYSGIYDQNSGVHGIMYDAAGNGGVYRQASSKWYLYYNLGNSCMGVNTSTTSASYGMYVTGAIYSTGDIVAYSDVRKKTDIVTIDSAISKVKEMRGVFYTRIDDDEKVRQVGVIAQEMNEVLPEAVTYASDIDEYGVKYGNIVGVLIEAIKEQQKEIDELKAKLN